MKNLLLLILLFPILLKSQINVGNDQTICLGDSAMIIATLQQGMTGAPIGSPILITECDPGGPDMLEIQNVSPSDIDVTGWRVIVSSSYTDINMASTTEQVLSGTMVPGEIKSFSDASTATPPTVYWGTNILWNPGSYPSFASWIILLDNNNDVKDVFIGNWLANDITNSAINTSVGVISLAGHWNGDGVNQTGIPTLNSSSRIGNEDNDDASDFTTLSSSANSTNVNLDLPFPSGATWYDLNTNQVIGSGDTIYYSPIQSTYLIGEVIDSLGNIWTDTMYLEVLNPNITSSGISLCNGPLTLNAPTSFANYSWSNGSSNPSINANNAGDYFVISTTSNGFSCQSDIITLYQSSFPLSLSTDDSVFICQGDVVIIDVPIGYSTYQWNNSNITNSISVNVTGDYFVTVTDVNGCTGYSDTTSIAVWPATITLSSTSTSLCAGPVTIDAGVGPATFEWYNNSAVIPNETGQTIVVSGASAYYALVTYPGGCSATSNILTITPSTGQFFFNINNVGSDSICLPNDPVILDAGVYSSYQWNVNLGGVPSLIPNGVSQTLTVTEPGTYFVTVIDANGCQGVSNPAFEAVNAVATSTINELTPPINQFSTDNFSVTGSNGSVYDWNITPISSGNIVNGQGSNQIEVYWNSSGPFTITVLETTSNGCEGEIIEFSGSIIISSIDEIDSSEDYKKIVNILGKEVSNKGNSILFYLYENGRVEKKIILK